MTTLRFVLQSLIGNYDVLVRLDVLTALRDSRDMKMLLKCNPALRPPRLMVSSLIRPDFVAHWPQINGGSILLWNLVQPRLPLMISICSVLTCIADFVLRFWKKFRHLFRLHFPLLLLALHNRKARAQRPLPRPPHSPARRKYPVVKDKTERKYLRHVISRPKRMEENTTYRQRKKHTRHCGKQTRWIFLTTIGGEAFFNEWRVLYLHVYLEWF